MVVADVVGTVGFVETVAADTVVAVAVGLAVEFQNH